MAVKRFYAADMHTAMNTIRAQLGEEAIILSTRKLADGVEVSASAGTQASTEDGKPHSVSNAAPKSASNSSESKPWYLNSISGFEEEHSALHSELGGITSLLQNWMDKQGWQNYSTQSPINAKLWQRFRLMGFDNDRISALLEATESTVDIKQAWQLSLKKLSSQLPIIDDDLIKDGGVFALVGAAGVGKTTTIGKLATRYVLEHGADSVALITTDRYRIAAHEQLRTFGKILGVSVQTIDETNSLSQLLDALRHKKLVLIDTAGINVNHPNFDVQMDQIEELRNKIQPVVLLAGTSQGEVQEQELRAYSTIRPVASIVTKTDESLRIGESLSLLIESGCPIAYTTHGQSIPEDIRQANANRIVNAAVSMSKPKATADESVIAGFNSVYTNTGQREAHAASVS